MRRKRSQRTLASVGVLVVTSTVALAASGVGHAAPATPVQWATVASPNPAGGSNYLNGVSCSAAGSCVAVGSTSRSALVLALRDGDWVRQPVMVKGATPSLRAVSCASTTFCLAVGFTEKSSIALSYDGTTWSQTKPLQPSSNGGALNAVSCPSAGRCWIAGQDHSKSQSDVPYVEHFHHGHWTHSTVAANGRSGVFNGIDCPSRSDCWAVGQSWASPNATKVSPLIEHWNGKHWTTVRSQGIGTNSGLFGVSCASSHDCYATGNVAHPPGTLAGKPFIERLKGKAWKIVLAEKHFEQGVNMQGISCVTGWCAAVGDAVANGTGDVVNYILEGRGNAWHKARASQPKADPLPTGVACTAVDVCDAVGAYSPGAGSRSATMILQRHVATPAAAPGASTAGNPTSYDIGCEGPLTGPNKTFGINECRAVELAVSKANQAGTLSYQLTVVKLDDKGDPAHGPAAASEAINDPLTRAVIGPAFSGTALSTERMYSAAGLLVVTPSATNPEITAKRSHGTTLFRAVGSDVAEGAAAGRYIAHLAGVQKVAVVDDLSSYAGTEAAQVRARLRAAGVVQFPLRLDGTSSTPADDARAARRIVARGADAVYYGGYDVQAGRLAKALHRAGYAGSFVGDDGARTPRFVKQAGEAAAEGAQFTSSFAPDAGYTRFVQSYRRHFHAAPGEPAVEAFDAANSVIHDLSSLSATPSPRRVVTSYRSVDWKGLADDISYNGRHELKRPNVFLYRVTNGKLGYQKRLAG